MRTKNTSKQKKITLIFYHILYSQYYHQHVSAAIAAIFRVILLKEYKSTNCDVTT